MPQRSIASRVEILEEKVASLEELPGRIDGLESQLLQFREENRAEHSAIRAETRHLLQILHEDVVARLVALSEQMRVGDEEARRYMRVLYEDLVERLAKMGEGSNRPRKRR